MTANRKHNLTQKEADLKRLQNFIDEEIDCIGMEFSNTEAWLKRCRRHIDEQLEQRPDAEFKGFELLRQGERECTMRYVDRPKHMTCHLLDVRLIEIPVAKDPNNHKAISDALHARIVNVANDDEGWIVIANVGKLIKAGVPASTFDLSPKDLETFEADGNNIDEYEILLIATDLATDLVQGVTTDLMPMQYLWIRD